MSDMIDDTVAARAADDGGLLLYDYFKHLTTLALVTLGGVLSISQGAGQVDKRSLIAVVVVIATAGAGALHGLDAISKARIAGRPLPKNLRFVRSTSAGLFSVGIGMFLVIFLNAFA